MSSRYNDVESEFDDFYASELKPPSTESELGIAISSDSLLNSNLDGIRLRLIERVYELLHSDFNRLKSALYQMDVDERKAEEAFRETSYRECAVRLADAIIEREIEKLKFRKI